LKKAIITLICVVLPPLALVSVVALAAGDWHLVGETAAGDKVSASSVRVLKNNQRTAWVRVEYKTPTRLPQGGPFVEIRARVHFNCSKGTSFPTAEWFYSRDRSGKLVVSKKATHDSQFGQSSEGGFEEMTRDYVCKQR
jgi:hypothetical protein